MNWGRRSPPYIKGDTLYFPWHLRICVHFPVASVATFSPFLFSQHLFVNGPNPTRVAVEQLKGNKASISTTKCLMVFNSRHRRPSQPKSLSAVPKSSSTSSREPVSSKEPTEVATSSGGGAEGEEGCSLSLTIFFMQGFRFVNCLAIGGQPAQASA